ncbi:unnamed protein product [Boreogadus saida]
MEILGMYGTQASSAVSAIDSESAMFSYIISHINGTRASDTLNPLKVVNKEFPSDVAAVIGNNKAFL